LESLEIKRQLGDKKGISSSLANLGVFYFEKGNDKAAVEYFSESIELKKEIREVSGIIATTHRVFSLLDKGLQGRYYAELSELDLTKFGAKENCWLSNIQLMDVCMNSDSITDLDIQNMSTRIMDLMKQTSLNDIDDLPIEAFYIAANRLSQLGSIDMSRVLAQQSLDWIGERRTRRKQALQQLLC
jgi:tetratricopeptide (TPR) repeat protein